MSNTRSDRMQQNFGSSRGPISIFRDWVSPFLGLAKAKASVGEGFPLTDEQLEGMVNQMGQLANVAIDSLVDEHAAAGGFGGDR